MAKSQVVKWGNSLAVRIPKTIAQEARMQEGDPVIIRAAKNKVEVIRSEKTPTLRELLAKITPANRYEETDWGADRGKEIVEW